MADDSANNLQAQLVNQLCFAVYDSHRLFNKVYTKALAPFELTYTQYIVLLVLWEKDQRTLTEISQELSLKSNTLTPVLKRLEKNGWISRKETTDKRSNCLVLTPKGQQMKQAILTSVQTCIPLTTQKDIALYQEALQVVKTVNERLECIDRT